LSDTYQLASYSSEFAVCMPAHCTLQWLQHASTGRRAAISYLCIQWRN